MVVALYDDDRGGDSGSAYVYNRENGVWSLEQKLSAGDGASSDHFGQSISLEGTSLVIGSFYDDDKGNNSGSVYEVIRGALCADDGACVCNYGYGGTDCSTLLTAQ